VASALFRHVIGVALPSEIPDEFISTRKALNADPAVKLVEKHVVLTALVRLTENMVVPPRLISRKRLVGVVPLLPADAVFVMLISAAENGTLPVMVAEALV
jgi:hypothetical protein